MRAKTTVREHCVVAFTMLLALASFFPGKAGAVSKQPMDSDAVVSVTTDLPTGFVEGCWDFNEVTLPGGGIQKNVMACFCYRPTPHCYYNPADSSPYCDCRY